MGIEAILFYAFAALAIFGAVAMVAFVRNLVAGALSLVVTMIALAGIYVLLEAHLVGAIQIMVYGGAILVLFLFVIMLLNLRVDDFGPLDPLSTLIKVLGAGAAGALCLMLISGLSEQVGPVGDLPEGFGGFRDVGQQLFTTYVVPVELAGLLLLSAIVGAVILAKRRID